MKIYVFCEPHPWGPAGSVLGQAVSADGRGLAGHLSSSRSWSQHDMGITSNWKHDIYSKVYPDGYELEWVDDPEAHEELKAALELNRVRAKAKDIAGTDEARR